MKELYKQFPELKEFSLLQKLFQPNKEYSFFEWGMIREDEYACHIFCQEKVNTLEVRQHSTTFCFQYDDHKQFFIVIDSPLAFKEWHRNIKCRNLSDKKYATFNQEKVISVLEKTASYDDVENFQLDQNTYACFIYIPEIKNPRRLSNEMGNQFVKNYSKKINFLSEFYKAVKGMEKFVEDYYDETIIKPKNFYEKRKYKELMDALVKQAFPT